MDRAVLEPLVMRGLGLKPMANLLETSESNVRYWIRKHGLKLKQKPFGRGYVPTVRPHKCCCCGETDPAKFYGHKRKVCGRCHNAYNQKQGRDKRLRAVQELGGRCSACGFDQYPCSLDIHHNDPTAKDPNFRSLRGWSWERIAAS
jgi:hypothetical protein